MFFFIYYCLFAVQKGNSSLCVVVNVLAPLLPSPDVTLCRRSFPFRLKFVTLLKAFCPFADTVCGLNGQTWRPV